MNQNVVVAQAKGHGQHDGAVVGDNTDMGDHACLQDRSHAVGRIVGPVRVPLHGGTR